VNLYIYLGVAYFVIFIGFLSAIQFERINQEIDFNFFQIIAAFFWPLVILSYWWSLITQIVQRRKNRRGY
jgi:hypothetical protein